MKLFLVVLKLPPKTRKEKFTLSCSRKMATYNSFQSVMFQKSLGHDSHEKFAIVLSQNRLPF